jgi:competence protein ComEC
MSTSADKLQLLPGSAGTRSGYLRSTIREALVSRIHRLWSPSDAALLDAMVVSERSLVARGARTDFQRSGVYHLLVVAGLHLGIITWFVYASLRRARVHDIFCTLLTLAGAVTYAWLADDGVPIWRATLMLAVYMLARFLYRDREPLNAIGLAALVLLVIDPLALFSPSFQLSFVAVLSIAALALPLLERTSAPYRRGLHQFDAISYDVSLPPRIAQFRLDLRMIAGRLACFLGKRLATWSVVNVTAMIFRAFDLVVISAAMQLCLALPMAWYFHRATTLSVPANVFAVPLAGLLLPATLVALAASTVSLTAARIPAAFAALTLHLILRITNAVSAFHVSDLRVPLPAGPVVLFVVAACVFATLAIRLHRAVAITGIALLLASAVALVIAPSRPRVQTGKLEITAIDVGQGDAFLIVTPDAHTLLIDAGGQVGRAHSDFDFGEDVVAPYLWSRGLRRLDAVALTHSHADHIGGMIGIIGGFHPRELWIGIEPDVEPVQQLLSYAAAHRVEIHQYVQGDHFDFGGVSFRALSPPADWVPRPREANNDSLGFELHYGNSTALMIGDVEKKVEREVATEVGPSGLLKIAHHGSSTSTTPEMLTAARPVYAVISAGHNNSFGHPRADVLARLAAAHVRTARTDMHGAVTFYFDGSPIPTVAGPTNP